MGGKRQANILSSIISNFQTVEDVIATSSDSAGSALKENEKYLDSVQGRIDIFKNSLQTMWMNFIDSDALKFIIDLGSAVLKLADTMGVLPTAVGVFTTIKLAAKGLKEVFDDTNVSAKELRQQVSNYIASQTDVASASAKTAAAKTAEAAATTAAKVADEAETKSSIDNAGANVDQAGAAEMVKDAKLGEAAGTGSAAAADTGASSGKFANILGTATGIFSKIGGAASKAGAAIRVLGAALGKAALVMLAVKGITWALGKAWDYLDKNIIHRAKNIKQEVSDLQKAYEDAKKTFDDNLTTLTTSSDTSVYATLQDEFNALAKGVDQYGNNISLTSDQYERYKSICEQIVGIQPGVASGYDSATEAIGNNANILRDLIELEKEQARYAAKQQVSDENVEKYREDATNDYKAAMGERRKAQANANLKADETFAGIYGYKDIDGNGSTDDDVIRYMLTTMFPDLDSNDINAKVQEYYNQGSGEYSISTFIKDYSNSIKQNADKFGPENNAKIKEYFSNTEDGINSAESKLKEAQNTLIDSMYLTSMRASDGYDNLTDSSKKFLTEWIKNSDQFKVDENTTDAIVKENRDKIIKIVNDITNTDLTVDFEGKQITGQDLLDQYYNFDPSTVNWEDYKAKMNSFAKSLSQLTGIDEADIKVALNIDFEEKEKNKQTYIDQIDGHIDLDAEQIQSRLDNMDAKQIKAFYEIDWNNVDWDNVNGWQDVVDLINQQSNTNIVVPVKTYADLEEAVSNLNDIQEQTEGISVDNTEVTQDYKDSLVALGATQEELNECFDESNPLLVKNASLLKKLVVQKKAEQAATIRTAKAQNQLQYKNTVNQLKQVVSAMAAEYKANGMVSNSTLKTVGVLRSQLTALKQTIQQYALLELKLTDAANAYDEFEKAKNRDAQLTYGDSMVEMLNAINEGFKTGKTGSDTFQAAVKALVPESVYSDIDNLEDRLIAIHDYIDKNSNFADYFTIDDNGNFSIEFENMLSFVQDSLDAGLFTGTTDNFFLADGIDSLDQFADKLGITQSAALAMLTELEKYDSSWGDIITDLTSTPLDREINHATDALDEALAAQEEFIRSGGDINSDEYKQICVDVNNAKIALDGATKAAAENAQQWSQLETVYASATGKIKLTQSAADQLAKSLGLVDENGNPTLVVDDNGTIQLTQDQVDKLNAKKKELEEPSVMTMQLRYDDIVAQIDELQKYIDGELDNPEDSEILKTLEITNIGDAQAKIDELTKERETITLTYNITSTTSEQETGAIEKLQNWESNGMTFSVNAQTEEAKGKINELNTEKDKLSEPETTQYEVTGTGHDTAKEINNYWNNIPTTKTTTYTVNENRNVKTTNVNGVGGADGTAHAQGSWGATKTETALVGELGPEILVRDGHWTTIGEDGAEFTNIRRGDIIFNHKQTEELLKNGYITSRGKIAGGSYANGTGGSAYYGIVGPYVGKDNVFKNGSNAWVDPWTNTANEAASSMNDAADSLSDSADSLSDATDEFEEVFDWVEVRLQEIDEKLDLLSTRLENAVGYASQNNIIDQMLGVNNTKMTNLQAGLQEYANYAAKLLAKIPAQYQKAAQDGAIAIEKFAGEADESTLEAIKNYREWAEKVADLTQQIEELKTEIQDLAKQKFDNVSNQYDNVIMLIENANEKLDAQVSLMEDRGYVAAKQYYESMMENTKKQNAELENEKKALQAVLDQQVKLGNIKVGSDAWYEMIDALYEVDAAIVECTSDLEEYQNAINDIYWDNFDQLINRLDYLNNETQRLIDLMDSADMVSKPDDENGWTANQVEWTNEGIASLGLYAQQMEIAEYQAKQYAQAIDDLNKDYKAGKYSENEYLEKLDELTSAQYDSIEAYYDAENAIKDLNETRIESIKTGIEAEISAYEELIEKKKEELDAEKD